MELFFNECHKIHCFNTLHLRFLTIDRKLFKRNPNKVRCSLNNWIQGLFQHRTLSIPCYLDNSKLKHAHFLSTLARSFVPHQKQRFRWEHGEVLVVMKRQAVLVLVRIVITTLCKMYHSNFVLVKHITCSSIKQNNLGLSATASDEARNF